MVTTCMLSLYLPITVIIFFFHSSKRKGKLFELKRKQLTFLCLWPLAAEAHNQQASHHPSIARAQPAEQLIGLAAFHLPRSVSCLGRRLMEEATPTNSFINLQLIHECCLASSICTLFQSFNSTQFHFVQLVALPVITRSLLVLFGLACLLLLRSSPPGP